MFKDSSISADQLDTARSNYEAAQAAQTLAENQLSYTTITSPIKVIIPNPNHDLKPGMPADGLFICSSQ
jgi:multidrug efflux pump subunit AcrA (membrane-fusion protein)